MYLLDATVTMDVNSLKFEYLLAILSFLLVLVAVVFSNGISFKWNEKEVTIGGIRRLLQKKDEDTHLKETLKQFSDDVDHGVTADLFDIIEDIDNEIDKMLLNEHCYFTMEKFSNLIKKELQKRVRRNNLREKLTKGNREAYINKILKDVEERYDLFQARVSAAKCDDSYADFAKIKDAVRNAIGKFFDKAQAILIRGMRTKIKKYEETAPEFKTVSAKKFSCDNPIEKNKGYIEKLTGEKYYPVKLIEEKSE
jgi:hypothetical protein